MTAILQNIHDLKNELLLISSFFQGATLEALPVAPAQQLNPSLGIL